MTKELTEEFAFCLGYELIYRNDRFILEGTGIPSIKGRIIDGIARDVAVCYDEIPVVFDYLLQKLPYSLHTRLSQQLIWQSLNYLNIFSDFS